MDETCIIRGRRVVFERRDPVETLRYSLDVFEDRDNLVEVLGRPPQDGEPKFASWLAMSGACHGAAIAWTPTWSRTS